MPVAYAATAVRLTQARQAAGFATPDAAAIALGLHGTSYRRHETGKHRAKPDELRRYADAFGVSVGWLSSGIGEGPK